MFSLTLRIHTFGPVRPIERADGIMQHANILYEQHESRMDPGDRVIAEDRMTL
jgi:hypothetical protein